MAPMAPPERPEDFFPFAESARTSVDGVIPTNEGAVVLAGLDVFNVVEVDRGDDDGGNSDNDGGRGEGETGESATAGRVALRAELEYDTASGTTVITVDVETCPTVVGVGDAPLVEAGEASLMRVGTGAERVGSS
jgi:hypothetical protein